MGIENLLGSFILSLGLSACTTTNTKYPLVDYARRGFSNNDYCNNRTLNDVECGKYRVYPLIVLDVK